MAAYNASLLRLAREQEGLTQKGLAEKLNVQQAVLSKYENGSIIPPENMQQKIAAALDYPVAFFLQTDGEIPSGLVFHRKRSSLLLSSVRVRIEAEVRTRSLDVIKLFRSHDLHSNIIPREGRTPAEMAKAVRAHWQVAPGPIDDLTALLEANGIVVLQFDFQTDKLDGFFMPLPGSIISIALNDNPAFSPDRRRHTLAHECGHALLEHCDEFPDDEREKEAEAFAAELLTPADCITAELQPPLTLARIRELKSRGKVSMGSLLKDMGMEENAHEQAVDELVSKVTRQGLGELVVTPREVDEMVGKVAVIIADGINLALQTGLSEVEIRTLSHDGP